MLGPGPEGPPGLGCGFKSGPLKQSPRQGFLCQRLVEGKLSGETCKEGWDRTGVSKGAVYQVLPSLIPGEHWAMQSMADGQVKTQVGTHSTYRS